MFSILSRSFHTATRLDSWDAPAHWHQQHSAYRSRRHREDAERERLRHRRSDTGQW